MFLVFIKSMTLFFSTASQESWSLHKWMEWVCELNTINLSHKNECESYCFLSQGKTRTGQGWREPSLTHVVYKTDISGSRCCLSTCRRGPGLCGQLGAGGGISLCQAWGMGCAGTSLLPALAPGSHWAEPALPFSWDTLHIHSLSPNWKL